jgi:hypothetical protein
LKVQLSTIDWLTLKYPRVKNGRSAAIRQSARVMQPGIRRYMEDNRKSMNDLAPLGVRQV